MLSPSRRINHLARWSSPGQRRAIRRASCPSPTRAQRALAILYERGDGIPKNISESMSWYRKAANQGDVEAQNSLTQCSIRLVNDSLDAGQ